VLASRITEENVLGEESDRLCASPPQRTHHDVQSIQTVHWRLREGRQITEGNTPIERTIDLVPSDALGRTARLGEERPHRPCRRARLGSLSGQLTI
jgi:hypothetical protein